MPEVSVIIPVYNAEKTVERCVRSVLEQDYSDLEIIAVDDGSTDDSGKLLDAISETDPRLIVLHVENGGVSRARNTGLRQASGKYVQFLDADDYITNEATKLLVRTMEENDTDLVIADFYRVVGDNIARKGSIRIDTLLTLQEFATIMMDSPSDFYYGVLWNKLYRNDIIRDNEVFMDEDLNYCEDFIFNMEYLLHCRTIRPLLVPVYYYIKTEGSLVSQSMSISKVVSTKILVYSYYNDFFRNVLDEKQYRKDRLAIAGYLINGASDDHARSLLPGSTMKLGEETERAVFRDDNNQLNDDVVSMSYYVSKLYRRYATNIALKNDMELRDVLVLAAISISGTVHDPKEITDFTGLSQIVVTAVLQHLLNENLIDIEMVDKKPCITIKDENHPIIHDIRTIFEDLEDAMYEGMDEQEIDWLRKGIASINLNLLHRL